VAAGVEGGSWDRIEEWTMARAEAMNSYWRRHAPPLHITAKAIAHAVGVKWDAEAPPPDPSDEPPAGPSIAELSATVRPLP